MERNEEVVDIWEKALKSIKTRINHRTYKLWLLPLKPTVDSEGNLLLTAPDKFFKEWVESRYLKLISSTLKELEGEGMKVEISFSNNKKDIEDIEEIPKEEPFLKEEEEVIYPYSSHLNPLYTFESFIVGNSNRLAHAAALAVSQSPGTAYNPLFIYGSVGLGKTHLLQAIGHFIKLQGRYKIGYLSSEKFTNQFILSIKTNSVSSFRQNLRDLDALLIDDIHFISGKEGIQEEFFHTFNVLYDSHKQVILSSDRPPQRLPGLEKRLVSRFEWGLVSDLQSPDLETRVAILKKKMELKSLNLSPEQRLRVSSIQEDVVYYIAENIKGNIRLLEGALTRLLACSSLFNKEINLDFTKEVLRDIILKEVKKEVLSIEEIQERVSQIFNVSISDLKGNRRYKSLVIPRQIAIYLCRRLTNNSLPQIGEGFGGKDHTTVMYTCKKIEEKMEKDFLLKERIENLMIQLQQKNY